MTTTPAPTTTAAKLAYAELEQLRATVAALRLAEHGARDLTHLQDLVEALLEQAPATPPHYTGGVQLLYRTIRQLRLPLLGERAHG